MTKYLVRLAAHLALSAVVACVLWLALIGGRG